jgi:integral membrane protein
MTKIQQFQKVAIAEGCSWIGLLVTMYLKRMHEIELPNKIVGWIHGILFILYCVYLAQFFFGKSFSFQKSLLLFIAAFVPFGTFWAERKLLRIDNVQK